MTLIAIAAETAAQHGSEGGAFPPFDPWHFPSQIFFLTIIFTALYLLLSRFILPRLGGVLEHRESTIANNLDEAARMNDQAVEAQNAVAVSIAQAQANARETAGKARLKIDQSIAIETAKIDAELDTKLSNAEARISDLRDEAMKNVESIATDAASNILAKFDTNAPKADIGNAVKSALVGS